MEFQKVFVRKDVTAVIQCQNCRKTKVVSAIKLIGQHRSKVKCTCGSIFGVEIDFRQTYRKKTDLDGYVVKLFSEKRQPKLLYESKTTDSNPLNCKIINISRNGITFTTVDKHGIKIGDDIKVKFTLDNSASTEFEKKAHVKWVQDNYIGGEFFETYKHDVTLAFYFL
ncbi:MAG: PilZ domain-containing protein [Pseudomonadota bacterium]